MKNQLSNTFSIVAVDPTTGVCGAAVASKFLAVGKVVPYVRAGVGAFCTQHQHNPIWGDKALDLLDCGLLPEEVLACLLRDDPNSGKRQLALLICKGKLPLAIQLMLTLQVSGGDQCLACSILVKETHWLVQMSL